MAIHVSGTTVVNNSRQLQNIASLDATTAATIAANAGGTDYELPPYETGSSDKNVLFGDDQATAFGAGGWRGTAAYTNYGDSTADNMIIANSFGGVSGSNQWLSIRNHSGSAKKFEVWSITNLTSSQIASTTTKTGPTNGYYKYSTTVPANTAAFVHYFWFEPTVIVSDAVVKWESGIEMYTRSGSGRMNGFTGIRFWYQGDVGL